MRALWLAAPLALTRYAGVLAAVVVAAALAAGAAASSPFVRAGVESSSLRGEVSAMSKYAAGLSIVSKQNPLAGDTARRAAALRFGRRLAFAGRPVLTTRFPAQVAGADGNALTVIVMARTGAIAHVKPLSGSGTGAWVSRAAAQTASLRPGTTLHLTEFVTSDEKAPLATVHIGHIYESLETNLEDPYWANLVQDIRPPTLDSSAPPSYLFVSEQTLLRLARILKPDKVDNMFEFPVAASKLRYVAAQKLRQQYTRLGNELRQAGSRTSAPLGCGRVLYDSKPSCEVSSSLEAALLIASNDVSALSSTIWLLSGCALGIALLVAAAVGVFLVRRRRDEAELLFARGERSVTFAVRIALECLVPVVVGGAAGFGIALLALRVAAPAGTLDSGTEWSGVRYAVVACAVAIFLVALTAGAAFPRRSDAQHPLLRRLRRVPWEILPLAGTGIVLGLLLTGGGLVHDASGDVHPSLYVFLLPVLAAAGLGGVAARAFRSGTRRTPPSAPLPLFFSARRIAAARGLVIAVVVAAATSLAVFAYATTLSSTVSRAIAEKAYVSNGSDVQGVVDPSEQIYNHFPFPAAIVEIDTTNAFISDGHSVDIVAGDPTQLVDVIRWGPWSDDPRPLIPRLDQSAPRGVLTAIASPDMPDVGAITDQGVTVPIHIAARAPFPGMSGGRPALLVSRSTLRQVAAAHHFSDPGFGAGGVIWARGDPRQIEGALLASNIRPAFLTTYAHIRGDPSVRAGKRSYGYLRTIGGAAVLLALVALLLYLQARQREQIIAGALLRRMGRRVSADAATVALETAALVLVAFIVGLVVAVSAARLVARHVDPLPQYAPGAALVAPWTTLLVVGLGAAVVAGLLAAGLVVRASRTDASEALRVA
ncbi:MAG TPA: FtsX-like permease family protein [Gaiellaceae bacterium]|nr:FtsX-like permease family protein [Gaiellaceae bacterium]